MSFPSSCVRLAAPEIGKFNDYFVFFVNNSFSNNSMVDYEQLKTMHDFQAMILELHQDC